MSTVTRREQEALEPKRLRRVLVGRPMQTGQIHETLLPKWLALPIFASDPLSSVAYATESALVVLVAASAASAYLVFPISIGIACLLGIVILSYRQTVRVYETSGGAYVVARENLGTTPSLVAAAALLTDYVLTVAVSISAGIYAITSFVPSLTSHKVGLSLAVPRRDRAREPARRARVGDAVRTPDLRVRHLDPGARRGRAVPGRDRDTCSRRSSPTRCRPGTGVITIFVLLRAFSSGSTALTGVEAIANGVNAFRHPQGKNAAKTLAVLGTIAITMFIGVSFLAVHVHAMPSSTDSVVSQIARTVFRPGSFGGFMYYAVQGTTLLVLVLAANTSFQGFPRLSALLARDRFAPRQFSNLGDRLVFSNGMLVLAAAAAALLVIYKANTNSLIHLYVIGVFTAFTLSQAGMVRYWLRVRTPGWRRRALVNIVGASATGLVTRDRDLDEVRRGSLARHGRDPGARRRDARRAAPLRAGRATAERRSCRCRGGPRRAQPHAARRRGSRPGGRARARLRPEDRAGRVPRDPRPAARQRSGDRPALVPLLRRRRRCSRRSTRTAARSTPCSSRSGGCRAASRTSSRSSSPSSSGAARSRGGAASRSSSRSSCGS